MAEKQLNTDEYAKRELLTVNRERERQVEAYRLGVLMFWREGLKALHGKDTEPKTETETETETESEPEPEPEPEQESEQEQESEPEPEQESEPKTETETETELGWVLVPLSQEVQSDTAPAWDTTMLIDRNSHVRCSVQRLVNTAAEPRNGIFLKIFDNVRRVFR
jgi:hypothetical protein